MFTESSRIILSKAETPVVHNNIAQYYRLEKVVTYIKELGVHRIALQFPDHLLPDTADVVAEIRRQLEVPDASTSTYRLFVLSDNTFGACCPDEITAMHYTAECIIHFGYACMSKTVRLPVMYVHEREEYYTAELVDTINNVLKNAAINSTDGEQRICHNVYVVLSNSAKHLRHEFMDVVNRLVVLSNNQKVVFVGGDVDNSVNNKDYWTIAGQYIPRLTTCDVASRVQHLIFVGSDDSPVLTQLSLIMQYNTLIGVSCGILDIVLPKSSEVTTDRRRTAAVSLAMRMVDKRLHRRMYNIERVKAAETIGILVCTLSIARYRESAEVIQRAIINAGKRCYIIYIGHLNEFKVANFSDTIDCFCVISCSHSRVAYFTDKSDNMLKPLVSPVEVLISLGYTKFDDPQAFTTEFAEVCEIASTVTPKDHINDNLTSNTRALINVGVGSVQRLAARNFRGLEMHLGQTPVQAAIVEGKSGIAMCYTTEKEAQTLSHISSED